MSPGTGSAWGPATPGLRARCHGPQRRPQVQSTPLTFSEHFAAASSGGGAAPASAGPRLPPRTRAKAWSPPCSLTPFPPRLEDLGGSQEKGLGALWRSLTPGVQQGPLGGRPTQRQESRGEVCV